MAVLKNLRLAPKNSHPPDLNNTREQTVKVIHQIDPDAPAKLTTQELSRILRIQAGSVRRALCVHGHYHGLTPIRLPNGRLIWPIA